MHKKATCAPIDSGDHKAGFEQLAVTILQRESFLRRFERGRGLTESGVLTGSVGEAYLAEAIPTPAGLAQSVILRSKRSILLRSDWL
jgi:hypothetical protein